MRRAPRASSGKLGTGAVVALVVAVVVIVAVVGYLFASGTLSVSKSKSNSNVTITAVDLAIIYSGTTSGYFGPSSNSYCPNSNPVQNGCSVTVSSGSVWVYDLNLVSSATLFSHQVNSITIQQPFTIQSYTPSVPQTVSPGGSVLFTINIGIPSTAGSYAISLTVGTT